MTGPLQRPRAPRDSVDGFALVACTLLVAMLMVIAIGLLSLSAIELRRSSREDHTTLARGNARLALMEAIGQLQRSLGPDQRVSATAEILGGTVNQPHWTGAWRTTAKDGSPLLVRDDLNGGLSDQRWAEKLDPSKEVLEWLVSGEGDPMQATAENMVPLVGPGVAGDDAPPAVMVPKVEMTGPSGKTEGHFAWWTGDLGVRASLSTADPRADLAADVSSPGDGGLYRVMASQAADVEMMEGGAKLEAEEIDRLASPASVGFTSLGGKWSREHRFDFTVASSGVLADVAGGGLKRDLTAYLQSGGTVPEADGLAGLSDDDPLVGVEADAKKSAVSARHAIASPRFGLLRDWANSTLPFNNAKTQTKLPELDTSMAATSRTLALANEAAVKLAGNQTAGLQPVLVEATNFTQWGTYVNSISAGGSGDPLQWFQLRTIMYPRVVLWNPYNVEMETDRLILMIQGNGRQEMWTQNENVNRLPANQFRATTAWISFEGGRSMDFGPGGGFSMNSEGYNDPYMGSYFFVVPATRFGPGECLVFSPPHAKEYDGRSVYRPGPYNLNANILSCEVAPDPSRCYYVSGSDIDEEKDGGVNFQPTAFWFAPSGVRNQSDDTRVIMKSVGNNSTVTFESFDALPQVAVVSTSIQYGSGREARISWNKNERMPIELTAKAEPQFTVVPNVRTRESIRLRWFNEHPSNLVNSGQLAGTPHFDEALLANWNPRASYSMRSPWENIAGFGGGPWFFGAYTRDLFDQAVSWHDQAPVARGGRYHGNPFGPPQEGNGRYILFDVPRSETGVVSLAQLQHAKISELIWHPSNAIGNSLADPRLGTGGNRGLKGTAAVGSSPASTRLSGFHESDIGWSSDNQRTKGGRDDWANTGRAMLANTPENDNLVYDLSFEVNRTLWDRYYLSTGSATEKELFLKDPAKNPLPNGRMRLAPATRAALTGERLKDFHQAAYQLMLDGAFNVNSTRVEAWKALLASTRQADFGNGGGVPFPRILAAPGGPWKSGDAPDGDDAWDGYRVLTDEEIELLAESIVEQVKLRGPFLSLADFVNRRLAEDSTGRMGALQAAIESAGLNANHIAAYPLANGNSLPNYKHPDNIADATRMEQTLKPSSKAWGSPTYLTQADVLQVIGPALSARSDTFVIRTYGDAVDADGNIQARAWCEATVQRTPEPIDPDESGLNPKNAGEPDDFGRRIRITSFRWLKPEEV